MYEVWLYVCVSVYMCVLSARGGQKKARNWVLGVEHVFSGRVTSAFNHRVISPAPKMCSPGWPQTCDSPAFISSVYPTSTCHHNRSMLMFKKKLHSCPDIVLYGTLPSVQLCLEARLYQLNVKLWLWERHARKVPWFSMHQADQLLLFTNGNFVSSSFEVNT